MAVSRTFITEAIGPTHDSSSQAYKDGDIVYCAYLHSVFIVKVTVEKGKLRIKHPAFPEISWNVHGHFIKNPTAFPIVRGREILIPLEHAIEKAKSNLAYLQGAKDLIK